ncbi:MAG: AAA family ATPase [Chlamydiales bacterium]|nr:AAA family ATPase [Chlamydiales bacterium]
MVVFVREYNNFIHDFGFESLASLEKTITSLHDRVTIQGKAIQPDDHLALKAESGLLLQGRISHTSAKFKRLQTVFTKASKETIQKVLQDIAPFIASLKIDLTEFAELFSLDKLEENWKQLYKITNNEISLDETIQALAEVRFSKLNVKDTFQLKCRRVYVQVRNFIENIVFTIESAFFPDQRTPPENAFEASFLVQLLLGLLLVPLAIGGFLAPIIPVFWQLCTMTAGITIVLILLLILWYNCLRPCPNQLGYDIRNFTDEAYQGLLPLADGREEELGELISILSTSSENNLHPMLLGDSGCGKTTLLHQLAYRIVSGNVPNELKNKKIFYINAMLLSKTSSYDTPFQLLERIINRVKGYEKEVIFAFDEAHNLNKLVEALKTRLEPGPRAIHFIGLTTLKEYGSKDNKDTLKGNDAFAGRLREIVVSPLSDDEIKRVHLQMVERVASNVHFSKKAIRKIIEITDRDKTLQRVQPARSKPKIEEAISLFRQTFHSDSAELKNKKVLLAKMNSDFHCASALSPETEAGREAIIIRRALKQEIEKLSEKETHLRRELEGLQEVMLYKKNLKREFWDIAAKIEEAPPSQKDVLKKLFLLHKQMAIHLKHTIQELRRKLSLVAGKPVTGKIDEQFIEEHLGIEYR